MNLRDLPIGRKLALILGFTTSIAVLLVTLVFSVSAVIDGYEDVRTELHTLAEVLGENSRAALAFGDVESARATLAALHARKDIEDARLLNAEGRLMARYVPPQRPFDALDSALHALVHALLPLELKIAHTIAESDTRPLGRLEMDVHLSELWQEMLRRTAISLLIALGAAALAIYLGLRLRTTVTQPLLALAAVSHQVTQSKDYSLRAGKLGNDEIGRLVDDFNRMLAEIEARDAALVAERASLEQRVAERTAKLVAAEIELKALNASLTSQVRAQVAKIHEKDVLLAEQSRHAAMGEMIGNIAHQWRQPLSMLALVIQNLRYDFKDGRLGDADVDNYVAKAMHAIEQMSGTIDDFRDFFKPNRHAENFRPMQSVRQCQEMVGASLKAHGIELAIDGPDELELHGYAGEFAQIVLNLVGNAKEALIDRQVASGTIAVALTRRADAVELTVEDNAGGIATEHLGRIFDPYFTTKSKGTGIGLYMTRTIVEQHMGGAIAVTNTPNGARFVVSLPDRAQTDGAAAPPSRHIEAEAA